VDSARTDSKLHGSKSTGRPFYLASACAGELSPARTAKPCLKLEHLRLLAGIPPPPPHPVAEARAAPRSRAPPVLIHAHTTLALAKGVALDLIFDDDFGSQSESGSDDASNDDMEAEGSELRDKSLSVPDIGPRRLSALATLKKKSALIRRQRRASVESNSSDVDCAADGGGDGGGRRSAMRRASKEVSGGAERHATISAAAPPSAPTGPADAQARASASARRGSVRARRGSMPSGAAPVHQPYHGWELLRRALRAGKLRAASLAQPMSGPLTAAELSVDVAALVRKCPLFASCPAAQLARVVRAARVVVVPRYQVLYHENTAAHGGPLILVASGSIRLRGYDDANEVVYAPGKRPTGDAKGTSFFVGVEAAASDCLVAERRRAETATVDERSALVFIHAEYLPPIAREQARVRANMRLMRPNGTSHSIFGDLPPQKVRAVAKLFRYVFAPPGTVLIRQGTSDDSFYELIIGEASVTLSGVRAEGAPAEVAQDLVVDVVSAKSPYRHLGDGSFVSWLAHSGKLGMHQRAASISTTQPSWCEPRACEQRESARAHASASREDSRANRAPTSSRRLRRQSLCARAHACPLRHLTATSLPLRCPHASPRLASRVPLSSPRRGRRLLEMPGHNFGELFEIVPGIVQRFQVAKEVQERTHALKREQLGEHVLRKMLSEQSARAEERNRVMHDARQSRMNRALIPQH
jgi:CRP-like cAMP-binding protein